jgi:hypothetical protein
MGQKIAGGCACGAIRYETAADPFVMLNCHCRDRQRAVGTAYAAVMVMPAASVTIRGEPRYFKTVGEAGKWVERGFCPICGSPVTVKVERFPDAIGFQAASLDDPKQYKPGLDLFTTSAQPWHHMHTETQKLPKGFTS